MRLIATTRFFLASCSDRPIDQIIEMVKEREDFDFDPSKQQAPLVSSAITCGTILSNKPQEDHHAGRLFQERSIVRTNKGPVSPLQGLSPVSQFVCKSTPLLASVLTCPRSQFAAIGAVVVTKDYQQYGGAAKHAIVKEPQEPVRPIMTMALHFRPAERDGVVETQDA